MMSVMTPESQTSGVWTKNMLQSILIKEFTMQKSYNNNFKFSVVLEVLNNAPQKIGLVKLPNEI